MTLPLGSPEPESRPARCERLDPRRCDSENRARISGGGNLLEEFQQTSHTYAASSAAVLPTQQSDWQVLQRHQHTVIAIIIVLTMVKTDVFVERATMVELSSVVVVDGSTDIAAFVVVVLPDRGAAEAGIVFVKVDTGDMSTLSAGINAVEAL
ncbi:hypothetical protein Pcinc_013754 [Petrolisthes cinctipes]|uniref:Uncharacterized protein n=1 Tax=Petrolisthes cinctipes TaxID=88211 RepID=A0AAE1FYG7_PETCI|nr:hypothetical protein Pcinc_013754 [Petrolisthes cinctipes]